MVARTLRNGLFATAAVGALLTGMNPAAADLLPFAVDPNALTSTGPVTILPGPTVSYGTYSSSVTATDFSGISNALIQQIGPSTQQETGYLQINAVTNGGTNVTGAAGLATNGDGGLETSFPTSYYGLYATFTGTVNGITGFGAGQSGTVGANDYQFTLYGDKGANTTFSTGSTSSTGGTAPGPSGNNGTDVVLAVGESVNGSVGFAPSTGAPQFDVVATFIVCNGHTGQGLLGSQLITDSRAASCGTFDATNYFVSPNPFYSLDFNSTTAGSVNNLVGYNPGDPTGTPPYPPNVLLNGITADINFQVPEPATLSIFGMGLLVLAAFGWRRNKNKGATA